MSDLIVTTKGAVMAAIHDAVATSPRLKRLADDSVQLDAALARVRDLTAVIAKLGWQPIETAPKDFVEVIVCDLTATPPVFTARFNANWGRSSGGISAVEDDFFGDDMIHPTVWMPLPEALK